MTKSISSESGQIKGLRDSLKLSQEEFANKVGVKRLAVSTWESGGSAPSADGYIGLAKLAQEHGHLSAIWFLGRAGLKISDLRGFIPAIEKLFQQAEKRLEERSVIKLEGRLEVPVPLVGDWALRGNVGLVEARLLAQIPEEGVKYVTFPAEVIPRPRATICVQAPDDFMYPLFIKGDFVAIDCSASVEDSRVKSVASWADESPCLVAAYCGSEKRDAHHRGARRGIHIRTVWTPGPGAEIHLETLVGQAVAGLPPDVRKRTLTPEELNQSAAIEVARNAREWLVLGAVIAWIGSNRGPRGDGKPKKK